MDAFPPHCQHWQYRTRAFFGKNGGVDMYLDMVKKMKAERQKNPIVSIGSTEGRAFPKKPKEPDPEKSAESPSCVSSVTFSIFGVKMPFDDFSIRLWEHFVKGAPIPFPMTHEQFKRYKRIERAAA
jgi:hypothetical protein